MPSYIWISEKQCTLTTTIHNNTWDILRPKKCCFSDTQCNWISWLSFGNPTYKTCSFSSFTSYLLTLSLSPATVASNIPSLFQLLVLALMTPSVCSVLPSALCVACFFSFSAQVSPPHKKSLFWSPYPKRTLSPSLRVLYHSILFHFLHKVTVYLFFICLHAVCLPLLAEGQVWLCQSHFQSLAQAWCIVEAQGIIEKWTNELLILE